MGYFINIYYIEKYKYIYIWYMIYIYKLIYVDFVLHIFESGFGRLGFCLSWGPGFRGLAGHEERISSTQAIGRDPKRRVASWPWKSTRGNAHERLFFFEKKNI